MNLRIKIGAAHNFVEIDGTRFDVPSDKAQRDGMRELVVNYYCKQHGLPIIYPDAAEYAR